MKTHPKEILEQDALHMINNSQAIEGCHVLGRLDLYKLGYNVNQVVTIRNCLIDNLYSPSIEYSEKFTIDSSCIRECAFNYAHFQGGLVISDSVFEGFVDFEAGGHNHEEVVIINSTFKGFVNFFDCWFTKRVIVKGNQFLRGTNLLGNVGRSFQAEFDGGLMIENNTGKLNWDGEGDKNVNTIILD